MLQDIVALIFITIHFSYFLDLFFFFSNTFFFKYKKYFAIYNKLLGFIRFLVFCYLENIFVTNVHNIISYEMCEYLFVCL